MRWEPLQATISVGRSDASSTDLEHPDGSLFERPATVRTFDTPQFAGMTFFEVYAKSILNKVPAASQLPFRWTINPYRGCTHACRYCFARNTHTYLDLDAGADFDSKVVVKINAPALLRKELARPNWAGEAVAMGTNVDCYQRAEGRYQLMPGILQALTDAANPFSILTKGSLILRDLPILRRAAAVTSVSTAVSVGFIDRTVWRDVEPGTPSPRRRLQICRTLNDEGISCGVLMAPILPGLTDSAAQLRATVEAVAEAGATYLTPIVLHLRPGAREWFMSWLAARHPELLGTYRQLYGRSAYAPKAYSEEIYGQVRELAATAGIGKERVRPASAVRPPASPGTATCRLPRLLWMNRWRCRCRDAAGHTTTPRYAKLLPMSMASSAPGAAMHTAFVVLDIDGVLADVRHRLHFLSSRPRDWDSFFEAAHQDPLLVPGAELAHQAATQCRIVYLTGRPERIRHATAEWLARHDLPPGELSMRGNNDRRPSRIMKVERLRRLAATETVALVVDDDRGVVTAVRAAGFTVQWADWMPVSDEEPDGLFGVEILQQAQEDLGRT